MTDKKERVEFPYKKLVYSLEGEHYICDYIFLDYWMAHLDNDDKPQGTAFAGATGTVVEKISAEALQERIDDFDAEEYWKMAVEGGNYTGGLDDYREELEASGELEDLVMDEYHDEVEGLTLADGERLDTRGGGRCFDAAEMIRLYREKPQGFTVHDEALYKAIVAVESGITERLHEEIAHAEISLKYESSAEKKKALRDILRHAKGLLAAKAKKQ